MDESNPKKTILIFEMASNYHCVEINTAEAREGESPDEPLKREMLSLTSDSLGTCLPLAWFDFPIIRTAFFFLESQSATETVITNTMRDHHDRSNCR